MKGEEDEYSRSALVGLTKICFDISLMALMALILAVQRIEKPHRRIYSFLDRVISYHSFPIVY